MKSLKTYSSQTAQHQPMVTVGEMLSGKYDDIHKQLYSAALDRYVSYTGIDKDSYRFVEVPASYYDTPGKVQVVSKEYPYKRTTVDLTDYWEPYMFKDGCSYLAIDEMTVASAEVKYRDYVRGYAEMESRITGYQYTAALKDVPVTAKEYPDENSVSNTFGYKVLNKIYGQ